MPRQTVSADQYRQALDALQQFGDVSAAARALDMPRTTYESRLNRAQVLSTSGKLKAPTPKPFEMDELPSELPTIDELLQRRSAQFSRKEESKEARKLISVRIKEAGPVGIALFGDPHLDDDGTDIDAVKAHMDIVNKTPGLLAACIGDYHNNWVGRLARLYGQQGTSAAEGWMLVEWMVKYVHWLFLVAGNHDMWSGDGDPIKWMAKQSHVQYESYGARLGLQFPNKRVIRLNAKHHMNGSSVWNTAHGPAKTAQLGWRDHVLVSGHLHMSGYNVVKDPSSGLLSHCLQIGSYKKFDRFADEKGFQDKTFMVTPVVIVRPQFDDADSRLISVHFEPESGASYLSWLRKRKSE